MKKSIYKIILLCIVLVTFLNCSNNDDNTATRSSDKIEITIDNGTPLSYSTNIVATDYPLSPITGFNCLFTVNSEDILGNVFTLSFGNSITPCPFVFGSTPSNSTLTGNNIGVLAIQNLDIDYANPGNSITFTYNTFGNNVGDDIKIIFSGNYFDSLGISHTISGDIDIKRS